MPSKITCADDRAPRFPLGYHPHASGNGVDLAFVEQPGAREARQRAAHLVHGRGRKTVEGIGVARLEVDDGHGMSGIGEHHGNAAAHAPCPEADDLLAHAHGVT